MDNSAGWPEGSGPEEEERPDRNQEDAEITRRLDELQRANRALHLLSAMNQALMHVTSEAELIQHICEIAVEVGHYRLAWVGFAEHDAACTVRPICHAGTELGYLHQRHFSWADDEYCDPAGMAIRTAKPTVLADLANMSTCAPWRAAALAHGLRSTIALPLQKDGQVIGALTLHGDAPNTLTAEEVQLLTELAGDLSFGIAAIRTRDRQRRAEEALRESEQRFRLLAENSTDLITRHTPEGIFRYVSPASQTLLGYVPEELVGQNALQFVHPDDLAMVQTFYQQLLTQQHVNLSTLTFRGRRKDDLYRWLEITARTIRDTDTGHVIEFQVATRDVTERQQAAQALQESDRRFRTLIANLPGMVYRCRNDQRWTMEYLSEGCRQLTGYAPDDLLQNAKVSYADLIHPDDAATVWEQVQRELQAHRPFQVTYRIITASGALKWVWEQGRVVVNTHGDVQNIEGYMTDITEWTEAEIAVQQREATLRAIFATALNVSFIITDADDRAPHVMEFSPGAEYIFGYTRDEMLGQPVNRLHRQEDIARFPATHRAMRDGRVGFSGETVLIRKNGDAFPALFSTYPLFDEQGNMYAALGVSIDISEQKRIEAQLRQTGEELDQFFNLAPDLLAIADTDGHFRRLNPSWERTLGYSREALLAGLFFDFVHPDDLARTHEAVAQLSDQRHVINFANRFRCRDGSYRWIEWLSASAGTRIYAAARDITDRLHAEEALRESEQRFRMLIERLPLPVAIYSASGDVEYVNDQFVKVLGYTLADISTVADWWPRAYPDPDYRREVMAIWTEALADAERTHTDIAPHEYRVTGKDGTVRTMEILAKNIGNTYLVLWNDVTERRRTEAALRLKEYQLEESQRNAHIGTYVLDIPSGGWTSSLALDDVFGIAPDYPHTVEGWLGTIHPDDREMMAHYLPEIAIPNRLFNKVYRIVRQDDGALRWVWGIGKITCSQEGAPVEMIGTIQDITERKLAEDALRESEERFRSLIEKAPVAIGMARHMVGIYANPAYERMFRLTSPRDTEVPVIDRYAPQVREWISENLHAREEGRPADMEYDTLGLRADGTEFPMHVAITRVQLPEGETTLAFITDITERKRAEDALRVSEERLRFALEGANEGVWDINVATHLITYMSPRDKELLGYAPEELQDGTLRWDDFMPPEDLPAIRSQLADYLAGHAPLLEMEQRLRMKSGAWKWVLSRGKVVERDAEGCPLRMTGTHTDITERKLAEQALQREQLFTNAILDSVPGLLYVYNANGYLVRWNKRHEAITGYSAEELAHKQILDWYQGEPDAIAAITAGVEKALREGYAEAEGHLITKSGAKLLFAYTAVRMIVEGEVFFVGIGIDITARRQAEDTINRERAFLASAIELLPFPIFFASTNQAIFRTNQACREFLHEDGLDQWRAITLLDPITHEPIMSEDRGLSRLFSGEPAPPPREVTMVFPDGREMPALLFMAPIAVGKESIAAVIAFQDLTLIKEADQAKNQFLKVISHELRTPLTSILGWAKMLQEAPELMPEAVPIILQSAHQFEGLLERMIILSRILTGKLTARLETVNLCTLATEVEAEFQPAAARKGITFTWLPPATAPHTRGDAHLLRMAVSELVDNAINFTPSRGRVTLTCDHRPDGVVTFTVTDTGRGITAEELPNIMKPFSQFRREEAVGGIGIGLTLVHGIAHAHHGEVVATSSGINQGATVSIELPIASEDGNSQEVA